MDVFGNTLSSLTVAYGRSEANATEPEQSETHLTLTLNRFFNRADQVGWYRAGLPVEVRIYEVVKPPQSPRLSFEEMNDLVNSLVAPSGFEAAAGKTIPYAQWDWRKTWNPQAEPGGVLNARLRLVEHVRTLYRKDDLSGPLPLGDGHSRALVYETYKLAFTPELLQNVFVAPGKVTTADLAAILSNSSEAGYKSSSALKTSGAFPATDPDDLWWVPSGRIFFSHDASATDELVQATAHFFMMRRVEDPFGQSKRVSYGYDLLVTDMEDAVHNRVTAENDYRMLQLRMLIDANGNRSQVAFDTLGMVVGTALMGKRNEPNGKPKGDSLSNFVADLTQQQVNDFVNSADPGAQALLLLGNATSRIIYELNSFRTTGHPIFSVTVARETHLSESQPGDAPPKLQIGFNYTDGLGQEIQKKIQAEDGPVPKRDADGRIVVDENGRPELTVNDVSPRWVGSGWRVYNNKGKPVRQYEPFFSDTHHFEFDSCIGVSPILFYDPIGRMVATLHPNQTWGKSVFDTWRQSSWDVSDTVTSIAREDADVGGFFLNLDQVSPRLVSSEHVPTWYALRTDPSYAAEADKRWPDPNTRDAERRAAEKASIHAGTPTVSYVDSLGRVFLKISHNRFKHSNTPPTDPPLEEFQATRLTFDIEGNQRTVIDARNRIVVINDYDMLGNRLRQASMESGTRWTLIDVAGKRVYAWDSREHQFRIAYDPLRRPTDSFLRENRGAESLIERITYGESWSSPETQNLRGKVVQLRDQAGVVTTDEYDFKGNLLRSDQQLAQEFKSTLDWSGAVPLEADRYVSRTSYDALNRAIALTSPDNSVIRINYNKANLLEHVEANVRGQQQDRELVWTPFVTDIDYNAKGQRTLIDYGNGVRTTYAYDPLTFALIEMRTQRPSATYPDDCPQVPATGWPGCDLQRLHYTFDPAGNITHIRDEAQQTIYFRNQRVEPSGEYIYDALYQLIEGSGREHLGQLGSPSVNSYNDSARMRILFSMSDGNAMGRYVERYYYDTAGNLQQMVHRGSDDTVPGWTRSFSYNEPSQLEAGKQNNRLTSSTAGTTSEIYSVAGSGYDAHGNMLRMPHLQILQWDFRDQLRMTQRQAVDDQDEEGVEKQGERSWYVYDSSGERVRKVTEGATGQVREERIYIGRFEVYRRRGANPLVRETLHVMDNKRLVALVETRVEGSEPGVPPQLIRYQLGNHLDSTALEVDDKAQLISYEEYTPFGNTSYQAVRTQAETPKRYRYTGKERDEETGFYYHGSRYFSPALARWVSADPAGIEAGANLYEYANNNPVRFIDANGRQPTPNEQAFTTIFAEAQLANPKTAHAQTLIRAFTDPRISDQAPTVIERTISILVLTGGSRPPNVGYLGFPRAHFNETLKGIGTKRGGDKPTGDLGFRPELRDSLAGDQHLSSTNQIGHFLTAVDIGIQSQIRQQIVDDTSRYQREHPILSAIVRGRTGGLSGAEIWAAERHAFLRGIVGHELIPDPPGDTGSVEKAGDAIHAVWRATDEDAANFLNGRLDLIRLDTSQRGNTYQDLLLSAIGYQFGVEIQQGRFANNAEAARWLTMALTEFDLSKVQPSDPFYQDAQKLNALVNQVKQLTQQQQQQTQQQQPQPQR